MTEPDLVPVFIVDDDNSVRDALSYVLEGYGLPVESFASGEAFLAGTDATLPACIILDSRMPGLSGQDVHQQLLSEASCMQVIFLTGHGDMPMAIEAFRKGACDFHQKPVKVDELLPCIKKAQQQSLHCYRRQQCQRQYDSLTTRERELFSLVVQGFINKQISEQLCISVRTVEVHRAKMMEKLALNSITDLVKFSEILTSTH
ncbi:response regulator transcription factor [Vibrio sp.]|uniref:response regulator transcription factor n=1 Tax=Vibrio sp. TaxID=678 RepID=UPI003D0D96C5